MTATAVGDQLTAESPSEITTLLRRLERPVWVIERDARIAFTSSPETARSHRVLAAVGPCPVEQLGDSRFRNFHGLRANYMAGAMANGIASPELVAAVAKAGYLGSYGAAGVAPTKVDVALAALRAELGDTPFACNLIHSPSEPALESAVVDACLRHGVRCVEASAYMGLTADVVRYRATGLRVARDGGVEIGHRLIAKVSRVEVADHFLRPAPASIAEHLVRRGDITEEQGRLVQSVPLADDITAEADSGGHTDRRPLLVLLPELVAARNRLARSQPTAANVRIGAAGGIGTAAAAAAAFSSGAAYVVTGSVNQSTVEAAQCEATKKLLASAQFADCVMAPSADMFELGVQVQVLRRGTMFASRAQRLYDVYRGYDGLDSLPQQVRKELEDNVFRKRLETVWDDCVQFFTERDPEQLVGAADDPKRRMALVFRWYLGLSSGWSIRGEADRVADYQVWCGPAMGAFNTWVSETGFAALPQRRVAEVGRQLMTGAAYLTRVAQLSSAGVRLPLECAEYVPQAAG